MVKPNHSFSYYLALSLFISTVLFIAGIAIGLSIDSMKEKSIEAGINSIERSIYTTEIELMAMDFFGNNVSCPYLNFMATDLADRNSELGKKVEAYEASNKVTYNDYQDIKKQYTLSLIKNWLIIERIRSHCNSNYTTILYFYSNKDCDRCENQGYILTYFKSLLEDRLMVFAIDGDIDLNVVKMLKYNYNITTYPSLVINGEVYSGFMDKNNLTSILVVE